MTKPLYIRNPEADLRPKHGLHYKLNYAILGNLAELRRLYLDERMPMSELAGLCNCCEATVDRWRRLYEIPPRKWAKPAPVRLTQQQRRAFIRETAARVAYQRFGECRDDRPHGDRCDSGGCPFDEPRERDEEWGR